MLYPVIDSLGLEQRWKGAFGFTNKEQAYFRLRGMIDVRKSGIPNSSRSSS